MRQVIVGTAGHIDHGKTALVKALTGHDTDTLAEEKRRGITIELGFAFLDISQSTMGRDLRIPAPMLPEGGDSEIATHQLATHQASDRQIVFIDVPGHEKLIRTMIAGAGNIDAVMLVIAADEGISRQTLEHFDIVKLLAIPDGLIALTKCDLVDEARLESLTAEVREFVSDTFLAQAPILSVSAVSGDGIDDLKVALGELAARARDRKDTGVFRMPVDRVFTMRGFGTVIAGTTLSGEVRVGDRVHIMPEGLSARIRGIQVHGESVEVAGIGSRTALNVPDVKKEDVRRGQCACKPGSLRVTSRLDVRLLVLTDYTRPLANRARVKVHIGTDELIGRVMLFECEEMAAGSSTYAQLVLEEPTVAVRGDRYVIRTFDNAQTIGGGVVLNANATVRRKSDKSAAERLGVLESGELPQVVFILAEMSGYVPVSVSQLAMAAGESHGLVAEIVEALKTAGELSAIGGPGAEPTYLHSSKAKSLSSDALRVVQEAFGKDQYKLQLPLADLYSKLAKLAERPVLEAMIWNLVTQGKLVRKGDRISLPGRSIEWKPGEEAVAARVVEAYRSAGYVSPSEFDLMKQLNIPKPWFDRIMRVLIDQGELVRLDERIIWHRESFDKAKDLLVEFLQSHGSATVGDLKDALGVSRKYAVPFLEYMDAKGITRRDDDRRVLRRQPPRTNT